MFGFNFRKEIRNADGDMGIMKYYTSEKWFCSDGDSANLYIKYDEKNNGVNFTLTCFSGIPESEITVGALDFGVLREKAKIERGAFYAQLFDFQCMLLANYLCSLFCEEIKS